MIEAAIAVHTPLIENALSLRSIEEALSLNTLEEQLFGNSSELRPKFKLPIFPVWTLPEFAREVGNAWDETTKEELELANFFNAFQGKKKHDFVYFSLHRYSASSMGQLIAAVIRFRIETQRARLFKEFRDGERDFESLKKELEKRNFYLKSIQPDESGALHICSQDSKMVLRDVDSLSESVHANLNKFLVGIGRRLAIGFNPAL